MTKHQSSAGYARKAFASPGGLVRGKRFWLLVLALLGLLALRNLSPTTPVASQSLDRSKGKAGSEKQPNMRSAWGIAAATDEVLKLSAQLGVRDIVIYGGPGWEFNRGSWRMKVGTDQPLKPSRAGYEDYLALRKRVE